MAEKVPKPRRLRGTPALKVGRFFCLGVLAVGASIGISFHCTSASAGMKRLLREGMFSATEEELDRKALMSFLPKKRGETIEKLMIESKDSKSF